MKKVVFMFVLVLVMVCSQVHAEFFPFNEGPGGLPIIGTANPTVPVSSMIPSTYEVLPCSPNLWWAFSCTATSGAMDAGYRTNAGYSNTIRKKQPDGSYQNYNFPWDQWPNDNGIYLPSGTEADAYPSNCDVAATEAGVFDRGATDWGHVDDFFVSTGSLDPDPWIALGPSPRHASDCIADYQYTSQSLRAAKDGDGWISCDPTGGIEKWVPPTYDTVNKRVLSNTAQIDCVWGLAQYYAVFCGYKMPEQSQAGDGNYYDDVFDYGTQYIKGTKILNWTSPLTEGFTREDAVAILESGNPLFLTLCRSDINGMQHMVYCFGWNKWELESDPNASLKLLVYDTWDEYVQRPEDRHTTYGEIIFPTPTQASDPGRRDYFRPSRGLNGWEYKLIAASWVKVKPDSYRCPVPFNNNEVIVSENPLAFTIDLSGTIPQSDWDKYHIHFRTGKDPGPTSPSVPLDTTGKATIPVLKDALIFFRVFRDADPPDAYLASWSRWKAFSIYGANRNIKKYLPGSQVTMVNGVVTNIEDENTFYFEDSESRLFGIKVHAPSHNLNRGDNVEVVYGTIAVDLPGSSANEPSEVDNYERYIIASQIMQKSQSTWSADPIAMKCSSVGGSDYVVKLPSAGGGYVDYVAQKGIEDGMGVNNVGMLIKITGHVHYKVGSYALMISEGWNASSPGTLGRSPVKVISPSYQSIEDINVGDLIVATGISSLEVNPQGNLLPVLKLRTIGVDIDWNTWQNFFIGDIVVEDE